MKHKKGFLPDWRINQVRKLSLRVAEQNFAQMIRVEMQQRGWKYDAGNNNFTKSGIELSFSSGIGFFHRYGSDGRLSKILHKFSILPEDKDLFVATKRMKEYKNLYEEFRVELCNQTLI